jgi:hypothetical protein
MNKKYRLNYFKSLLISAITIFFFSYYQINFEDLWFDELLTFSLTNPYISNIDTYNNLIKNENTPLIYFYLIKSFFYIFGYDYQLLRIPNIYFNLFSLIAFFFILKLLSNDRKFIFLSLILFSLNYFIISYAHEGRVYSFYCLISLIYILNYLTLIDKNRVLNFYQILKLFILSLILINTFLFSFLIIGIIMIYNFFLKSNNFNFFKINLILITSFIISFYFNYDFYERVFSFEAVSISNPKIDFYLFNFFFKQFFGSKIMGYTYFILFVFSLYTLIKNKIFDKKIIFLILLVFLSYLVPIIYGYLFSPVLSDKYIFYVVPIIILIISFSVSKIKNSNFKLSIIFFLIILSLSNQILKNIKQEIDKPEFTKILNILKNQNQSNNYVASFMDHRIPYFNYIVDNLVSQISIKNNLSLKNIEKQDKFWVVCYDPSNTYQNCLSKNILINDRSKIIKEIYTYQVVALLMKKTKK